MKRDLSRTIEIPSGVNASINKGEITIKGNGKETKKKFEFGKVKASVEGNKILLSAKAGTRRESKMMGTIWANINNMIKGLKEDFVYHLEVCNVHFPMNVKVDGNKVLIKSFLGEKVDRVSEILPGAKVEVKGSEIIVKSHDRDIAGQTAANLERTTKITGRDRRIFQDGIFITSKPGRKI